MGIKFGTKKSINFKNKNIMGRLSDDKKKELTNQSDSAAPDFVKKGMSDIINSLEKVSRAIAAGIKNKEFDPKIALGVSNQLKKMQNSATDLSIKITESIM